ncbi:MAG: hypothetical protein JW862_04805 [Anaerolineales bacterium]|nr:hypothetical protein [Anaerolineales bacterium]
MKFRDYGVLFALSLVIYLGVAVHQSTPGYMDADYYYAGGLELARGNGLVEMFIWNYLNEPAGIPHPGFAYWMPATALVAAAGMRLTGQISFAGAQSIFVVLAAMIAPITAALSYQWRPVRRSAFLAGGLAALPAFYLPFLPTTDSFALYALLGGFFILLAVRYVRGLNPFLAALITGLLAGGFHLSRADGVVWLGMGGILLLYASKFEWRPGARYFRRVGALLSLFLGGYLLIMLPWMVRNWIVFGALLSPSGGSALWIVEYNDLFIYPAEVLSFERWWAQGWQNILSTRWWALKINLQRTLAEQGLVMLLPLMILGVWRLRREKLVRFALLAWVVNFVVMTLVFPLQGARGGYFHSAAALLPFLYSVLPVGLDGLIMWGEQKRKWNFQRTWYFFAALSVGLAILLSGFTFRNQVLGSGMEGSPWDERAETYSQVGQYIRRAAGGRARGVMVVNPPGYYLATGEKAIAIPDTDLATARQIAQKYEIPFLVLEPQHPQAFGPVYENPDHAPAGFELIGRVGEILILRFQTGQP